MKSNVVILKKKESDVNKILIETEKVAKYNDLSKKERLRLTLLSEEVAGMLKELVKDFDGEFWIENEDKNFSINFSVKADSIDMETKEKLLAVSTTGKNELAKGFMGKIRSIIQIFAVAGEGVAMPEFYGYYNDADSALKVGQTMQYSLWSLDKYKTDVKNKAEWDELEKSIVANLADDVTVGVMGRKVTLTVKKSF